MCRSWWDIHHAAGLLGDGHEKAPWNLARCTDELEQAGLHLDIEREETAITWYFDIETVVAYFNAVPWEVPDFSIDRYFDNLVHTRDQVAADGYLDVPFHTFFIVAHAPR